MEPRKKFQIHQSGLVLAASCGEAYRRRYIEGERGAPRSYQAVGSAVDRSVRENLASRIERGELLPIEQVLEVARDNATAGLVDFEPESRELDEYGSRAAVQGAAIDKAVRLSRLHAYEVAPEIEPLSVAHEFTLDIEGEDFQITGEIDVRAREGQGVVIRDTKTKKTSPPADAAEKSIQLTTYALAELTIGGALPSKLALDTLVDLKRGPEVRRLETTRTMEHFPPLLNRIAKLIEAHRTGHFQAADPSGWKCSKGYCEYWQSCAFAMRPIQIALPALTNVAPERTLAERVNSTREA